MTAAKKLNLIAVEEYLAGELISPIKHEYLGGVVYAMAGARNAHNLIAGNTFLAMGVRLRGRRCRPFNSDTKIRIILPGQIRFYYPDVSVTCRPNSSRKRRQSWFSAALAKGLSAKFIRGWTPLFRWLKSRSSCR